MAIFAYLRVSTTHQDLEHQRFAIKEYAKTRDLTIDDWVEIKVSSRKRRKERRIAELLSRLRRNDTLVIFELSRLARSLNELVQIVEELIRRNIRLIAIKLMNVDRSQFKVVAKPLLPRSGLPQV